MIHTLGIIHAVGPLHRRVHGRRSGPVGHPYLRITAAHPPDGQTRPHAARARRRGAADAQLRQPLLDALPGDPAAAPARHRAAGNE